MGKDTLISSPPEGFVIDPADGVHPPSGFELDPAPSDTWDYVFSAGGSVRNVIPLPAQPAYDGLLSTVKNPKEFEDSMTASLYLSSVLRVDETSAFDLQEQLGLHLFKEPVSPSQMVSRAIQNEEMINRAIQAWNIAHLEDEPPSWWKKMVNASARGLANVGSGVVSAGKLSYGYSSFTPEFRETGIADVERNAQLLWQISKDPELASQSDDLMSQVLNMAFETIPYITATSVGRLTGGPYGGFAVGYMIMGNSAYRKAKDAGVSDETAHKIGAAVGIVSGAIESFGGLGADKLMTAATAKIENRFLRGGADLTIGSLTEALEEAGQEVADITGEEIYRNVSWKERIHRVLVAGAGGGALGGLFKTGSASLRGITGLSSSIESRRALRFLAAQGELSEQVVSDLEAMAQEATDAQAKEAGAEGDAPVAAGAQAAAPGSEEVQRAVPEAAKPRVERTPGDLEALSDEQLAQEAINLPKTHVAGLGMGEANIGGIPFVSNEFEGTYLSTEEAGNRYADAQRPSQPYAADITNPKIFRSAFEYARYKDQFMPEGYHESQLGGENAENVAIANGDEAALREIGLAARKATESLKAQGYDSVYLPESERNEGILVVFDKAKAGPAGAEAVAAPQAAEAAEGVLPTVKDSLTVPAPEQAGGKPATITAGKPEEGPERKVSRAAERIQEEAIAKDLTESLGELPTYETMSMTDQARMAAEEIARDYENAKQMAYGKVSPPSGLRPASIYRAVAVKARTEGDVDTLRNLAVVHPQISLELTAMGQAIKAADVGTLADPVKAMQDVQKAKEKAVAKRRKVKNIKSVKKQLAKEAKAEIAKKVTHRQSWTEFVEGLRC